VQVQAWRAMAPQIARFIIVGLANTATTYAAIWLLHAQLGISVSIASATGYVVGAVQGFLLSRYWTFAHAQSGAFAPQALGFVLVNLLCAAIFSQLVVLLEKSLPLSVATVGATLLIIPVSFILYRWWVFRHRGKV
jgi:putative flippase GtrA